MEKNKYFRLIGIFFSILVLFFILTFSFNINHNFSENENRYLQSFAMNNVIYEIGKTKSELSDKISKDLYKRGMKFVGSTILYSYLQAIGIINSHEKECAFYKIKGR